MSDDADRPPLVEVDVCYCIVTQFPFLPLHFSVLRSAIRAEIEAFETRKHPRSRRYAAAHAALKTYSRVPPPGPGLKVEVNIGEVIEWTRPHAGLVAARVGLAAATAASFVWIAGTPSHAFPQSHDLWSLATFSLILGYAGTVAGALGGAALWGLWALLIVDFALALGGLGSRLLPRRRCPEVELDPYVHRIFKKLEPPDLAASI